MTMELICIKEGCKEKPIHAGIDEHGNYFGYCEDHTPLHFIHNCMTIGFHNAVGNLKYLEGRLIAKGLVYEAHVVHEAILELEEDKSVAVAKTTESRS